MSYYIQKSHINNIDFMIEHEKFLLLKDFKNKKIREMENNTLNSDSNSINPSDEKLQKLLNDAKLHVNEAESVIRDWNIKYSERARHLTTIEIIIGKK
jgi:hypothetical protein